MDRRKFLSSAAATLIAGRARARDFTRAPARAVLLLPLSGEQAALGQMLHGTALAAVDAINRAALGGTRAVQVRVEDWRSDPRRFDALVRQYGAGEGRPAALFGPCPYGLRAEVSAWLETVDSVLWDPQPHTGGQCHGGIVPFGSTPYQSLSQSLPYMAAEVGRRFLLVPGEDGYGRELAGIARWALGRMGAEVVGEAGPGNRQGWLARLRRERVDVVFCTLAGAALAEFLRAYAAARLDPLENPILCPSMSELDVVAAGPAMAAGHVACQPYFADWPTLGNQRFRAALRHRLPPGQAPTAQAEALWGLLHLFTAAVAALDDVAPHPVLVREAARGREVLLPQGRVRLDAETLHPVLWPKLAVATAEGGFKVIASSDRPVAPLPFWGRAACPATGEVSL
ncbi:MAG: transporter substrate-binding protein [Bacteroidota bacterium]